MVLSIEVHWIYFPPASFILIQEIKVLCLTKQSESRLFAVSWLE